MSDLFDIPAVDTIKPKKEKESKVPASVKVPRNKLREGIEGIYGMVGMIMSVKCMECGKLIVEQADQRAEEWLAWADTSPQVKRILELATTGTVAGAVLVGNAAMIVPVLSHHGIISSKTADIANAMNGQQPEVTEEQLQEFLRQQSEATFGSNPGDPDGI